MSKMVQQFEMSGFARELYSRITRKLHITISSLFLLAMASFVVVLGTFTFKLFVLDGSISSCFPRLDRFSPPSTSSPYSYILCNFGFPSFPPHTPFNSSLKSKPSIDVPRDNDSMWHPVTDDRELMRRAAMVRPNVIKFLGHRTPKVAFMFLSRGSLPLAPVWEKFFMGHEGLYSIYIHTSPEFVGEPPVTSVFYKRKIPSEPVHWGSATMVDAERRLLANALLDHANERFVLLSEACIPLFNFTTVYNYLIGAEQSFISSFDDPRPTGRGRYNKRMSPRVSLADWRKGSQWFEVNRNLAVEIISDDSYYPLFRNYCRPPCYVDEHYVPTLVNIVSPQLNTNRSITWVDWSNPGPHPREYVKKGVSMALLNLIRQGSKCTYNGRTTSICFLFARKFHPSTLDPLLRMTPVLFGFNV
ncbi:hypothetical protein V6N11_010244 [Hibiscus sabdariffa]|uniref:Core-2/I-branching beta-1,6-N-acetylglucosaminyltransferase family protein n=1 Tax=Hibiscus sabdariffa TaxID=183260 RepID=A0ABR2PE22_9ROSI